MLSIENHRKLQKILQEMETMAFEATKQKMEHVCWSLGISELTKLTESNLKQYCLKCATSNCLARV